MRKYFLRASLAFSLVAGPAVWAQALDVEAEAGPIEVSSEFEGDRDPAATRQRRKPKRVTQLPKKKLRVEKEEANDQAEVNSERPAAANSPGRRSEADSSEGWIIRRTKDGIIKVPKKETFKFEGGEISGAAQRPSQTVLGSRPQANRYSLLPERKNYRSDILGSAGAASVVGTPTSGLK
jgi:hypothetical protein